MNTTIKKDIGQSLENAFRKLKKASKTPQLDAEVLLAHVLKKPREWILTHPDFELDEVQISKFKFQISRRSRSEPIAYIIKKKDFYGLDFYVDRRVLIPRPETELMIERGLELLYNLLYKRLYNKKITVIDVGTGSGAVIVSAAKKLQPKADPPLAEKVKLVGVDISEKALEVARKNARKHEIDDQIEFLQSDLLEFIKNDSPFINHHSSIIILANLPYVSQKLYKKTTKDVRDYEPKSALISGQDGLDHYRKLFNQIKTLTTSYQPCLPAGRLPATILCEISPEQKPLIKKEILARFPRAKIRFHKDLANQWRLVEVLI